MKYEVEIYGNEGAGKTVLLAALYNLLDKYQDHSIQLEEQANLIYKGKNPERTRDNREKLSFDLVTEGKTSKISVTVTAHAGEEHTASDDATAIIKRQFVTNRNNKLLVVVVNPFLYDADLAWKTFRNLVAYLQHHIRGGGGAPISIKDACYTAVNILFHIEREVFSADFARGINNTFNVIENDAILKYDCSTTDLESSFRLVGVSSAGAARFKEGFKQAIDSVVNTNQGKIARLQNLMANLDNSMLVLSHVDLANKLTSIKIEDFDKVFNRIFDTPNRSYRRQLLARNLELKIDMEHEQMVRPGKLLTETASQFYENIKSFAIEAKTGWMRKIYNCILRSF